MKKKKSGKGKSHTRDSRSRARVCATILFLAALFWSALGVWFVHHPNSWHKEMCEKWPAWITSSLFSFGNPIADILDSLNITGSDVIYEYDEEAPNGKITFAGIPERINDPAPKDICVLNQDEFIVGWSPKLRHPVWVAYHVPANASHEVGKRPNFKKDITVPLSPKASAYEKSGYDRGHMAPNYAITSRFGEKLQEKTFLMSNIVPQSASLNRGIWREVERRIADLWTARWGEIWVIVGCIPSNNNNKFGDEGIDIPSKFYQIVVAQEGYDIRAFALLFDQNEPWDEWPTRHIVTIDELEEMTGFNFLPELPDFIQRPLESSRPTRLWPIRKIDIIKQILLRFPSL